MASIVSPADNVDKNIDTNEEENILPFNEYYIDAVIERTYPFINMCDHFIINFSPKFVNYFIGRYDLISTFEMDFAQEDKNYERVTKRAEVVHPKTIKYAKKVRGVFSVTNIFDGIFWMWTKYLDADSVAFGINLREQKQTELVNVGLLSALLFTVSFEQLARVASDQANDPFELDRYSYMFICGWTISGLGFLLSTIWTVLFSIAINETYDSLELKRFLTVFDHITCGIGPMFHIQTMYIGLLGFIIGLIGLGYSSFSRDVGNIIVFIEYAFMISIVTCGLQMFASLRHSRTITAALSCSARFQDKGELISNNITPICCKMEDNKAKLCEPCDLRLSHIHAYLIQFLIDECNGNVNLCDANDEEFISYIVAYSIDSDCQVDADTQTEIVHSKMSGKQRKSLEVDLKAKDNCKNLVKLSGQRLNNISEKRARQFFNHYIEANLFESIEPQDFDIKAYLKK